MKPTQERTTSACALDNVLGAANRIDERIETSKNLGYRLFARLLDERELEKKGERKGRILDT